MHCHLASKPILILVYIYIAYYNIQSTYTFEFYIIAYQNLFMFCDIANFIWFFSFKKHLLERKCQMFYDMWNLAVWPGLMITKDYFIMWVTFHDNKALVFFFISITFHHDKGVFFSEFLLLFLHSAFNAISLFVVTLSKNPSSSPYPHNRKVEIPCVYIQMVLLIYSATQNRRARQMVQRLPQTCTRKCITTGSAPIKVRMFWLQRHQTIQSGWCKREYV